MKERKTIAGLTLPMVARILRVDRCTPYKWVREGVPTIVAEWAKERERRISLEIEVSAMHHEMLRRMTR